jgi:hypothetical protein
MTLGSNPRRLPYSIVSKTMWGVVGILVRYLDLFGMAFTSDMVLSAY